MAGGIIPVTARFRRDRRGSVTIMSAVLLPVLIGIAALVAEFGSGLLTRVENQRVADLAAYAGALAYSSSGSTATMNSAIGKVAVLNGLPSSAVTGSLVTSPTGNGNQAVSVSISTSSLLMLAPVLGGASSLSVKADAQAEISAQSTACILALKASGTGVTLAGGAGMTAASCAVASNNTVTVPCAAAPAGMVTKNVTYNSASPPSQGCANSIRPPSGTTSVKFTKAATPDPLAGNPAVATLTSRLATVNAYTAPAAPTVAAVPAGKPVAFGWSQTDTQTQATAAGCSASWASATSTWTLTCPAGGTYNFSTVTIGGGIKLRFVPAGTAATTYTFANALTTSDTTTFGPGSYTFAGGLTTNGTTTFDAGTFRFGAPLVTNGTTTFGAGTFTMAKGLTIGGGATTTFGAGTFTMGASTSACQGGGFYSICHPGTALTFGGPSTFVLSAGINVSGNNNLTLGSGTTNSFTIGAASTGDALNLSGSGRLSMGDALGATVKLVGNVNMPGGGSCLAFPAAAEHDVKGFFSASGGIQLGAGRYTVTGYVGLGVTGGGNVDCWGSSLGLNGTDVNLTIGGASTVSCGTNPTLTTTLCMGAGYRTVTLVAPTTGTFAKLAVIGPTSASTTAGASFTAGASGTSLSGALYFPNGPVNMSGGAGLGGGSGQCLQIIGSQVTMNGGSAAASTCIGAAASATTALLVR